jgi:hypothetical protein
MERGDLGAELTVLTSQIDFLIMGYSTIALGMLKSFGDPRLVFLNRWAARF